MTEVLFWTARLEGTPDLALLSDDERARVARFVRPVDARRAALARVSLRRLLGRLLGTRPEQVRLRLGSQGKPALLDNVLHFNLSHSEDRLLIAVCADDELGCDLERLRPQPDLDELARTAFSPAERAAWLALPPDQRLEGFFRVWTCKEALLKALGEGLLHPLHAFDVSVTGPPRLLRWEGHDAQAWSLAVDQPEVDTRAAFAMRRPFLLRRGDPALLVSEA